MPRKGNQDGVIHTENLIRMWFFHFEYFLLEEFETQMCLRLLSRA